jgi:MFS family permease
VGGDGERRQGLVLVLTLSALLYALGTARALRTHAYLDADAPEYVVVADSLVRDGDLDLHGQYLEPYATRWNRNGTLSDFHAGVSAGRRGEWYPKSPWFYSALLAPVYGLFGPAGGPIAMLAVNLGFGLALAACMYLLGCCFAEPAAAAGAALAVVFLSTLNSLVLIIGVDTAGALAVTAAAMLIAAAPAGRSTGGSGRAGAGWWLGAGAAAGLAALLTARDGIILPFLAGYALARGGWRAAFLFAAGAAPPLLLFFGMNWRMFGNPFTTSYDRVMVLDHGVPRLASHRSQLAIGELGPGLARTFLALLRDAPAALVAQAGWPFLRRRDRRAALWLGAGTLAMLLFTAAFRYSEPARFLLPAFGVWAAPLAALFPTPRERSSQESRSTP